MQGFRKAMPNMVPWDRSDPPIPLSLHGDPNNTPVAIELTTFVFHGLSTPVGMGGGLIFLAAPACYRTAPG